MKPVAILVICLFASVAPTITQQCSSTNCAREESCICISNRSPIELENTPQFVTITFDDALIEPFYDNYLDQLINYRTNPDGNPISASFFVPHKYTNYEVVNRLYNAGHDIGVHSITKTHSASYWSTATLEELIAEFGGQKTILNLFANIPNKDIEGARIPQLQMAGDKNIQAYVASNIVRDSSWATRSTNQLYPYTLDFPSSQSCLIGVCPATNFTGFLVLPINNFVGTNDAECNSLLGCEMPDSTEEILDWLLNQFNRIYSSTKAPQTYMLSSAWFTYKENAFDAFSLFLDELANKTDVFIASHSDVHRWMLDPVPLSEYTNPQKERNAKCNKVVCPLLLSDIETIYMTSCIPCPDVYPWIGNPEGKATK